MIEGAKDRLRSPRRIQVDALKRYALMEVGGRQFAYSDQAGYLRALGCAWSAGLLPEPLPSALGKDLPAAAPLLDGVDRLSF